MAMWRPHGQCAPDPRFGRRQHLRQTASDRGDRRAFAAAPSARSIAKEPHLNDVDLAVRQNEIVALLDPQWRGAESTLLNL